MAAKTPEYAVQKGLRRGLSGGQGEDGERRARRTFEESRDDDVSECWHVVNAQRSLHTDKVRRIALGIVRRGSNVQHWLSVSSVSERPPALPGWQ
jgi:hypothetical protein